MKVLRITHLRAEESGGYSATYQVGETPANGSASEFVEKITTWPADEGGGATIDFQDGTKRVIPEHRIISYDLAAEETT